LVFETRDPARRAWLHWTPERTLTRASTADGGSVRAWCEVLDADGELVTFRWTHVFEDDGVVLTSDSTLRFRSRAAVESALTDAGFVVVDVRDAPDRPGREFVFVAVRRP
jgi:hypothetical protein